MLQLPQCLLFDLSDTFSSNVIDLTNLFKGSWSSVIKLQAKARYQSSHPALSTTLNHSNKSNGDNKSETKLFNMLIINSQALLLFFRKVS